MRERKRSDLKEHCTYITETAAKDLQCKVSVG